MQEQNQTADKKWDVLVLKPMNYIKTKQNKTNPNKNLVQTYNQPTTFLWSVCLQMLEHWKITKKTPNQPNLTIQMGATEGELLKDVRHHRTTKRWRLAGTAWDHQVQAPGSGQLEQVAQDHIQLDSEYLHRWQLHKLCGKSAPVLYHPHRTKEKGFCFFFPYA